MVKGKLRDWDLELDRSMSPAQVPGPCSWEVGMHPPHKLLRGWHGALCVWSLAELGTQGMLNNRMVHPLSAHPSCLLSCPSVASPSGHMRSKQGFGG